jgi:hypothetical protein
MIANQNLPHECGECNKLIVKGDYYIYNYTKKLGSVYYHFDCFKKKKVRK